MAFTNGNFKEAGGPGNEVSGGQLYTYHSEDDTLATIMASGHFDSIQDVLNNRDNMVVTGTDGTQIIEIVNTAGVITSVPVTQATGAVEAIAGGGGAAGLTPEVSDVTSTGADVITLANGTYVGQTKTIICSVDGGSVIVTPATTVGAWSTCTLLAVGDTCYLMWNGTGWVARGVGAGTVALPIFA